MGRITGRRSSYGHRIYHVGYGYYKITWSFDTKIQGSRLRWPRSITRETDEAGALKFSKKWNVPMPERKTS